jgi:uncharacterized protein (TIGR02996 family)
MVMYNGPVAHDHPREAPVSAEADGLRKAILDDTDDALAWNAYADWLTERSFDKAAAHVRAFGKEPATPEGLIHRHVLLESSRHDAEHDHAKFCGAVYLLWENQVAEAIEELLGKHEDDLIESDAVNSAIEATNATRYRLSLLDVTVLDIYGDICEAAFTFSVRGFHDPYRTWAGDTVSGSGTVEIKADLDASPDKAKLTVELSDITAEVDHGDE